METSLGPYVLGGLEPDEDANVRRHLHDCAECLEALSEIAWIPSWLEKIPAEELERLIAEDENQKSSPARHRGPRVAAVVAVVIAIAMGVTTELVHDPATITAGSTVRTVDQQSQVAAALTLTPQGTTTGLRLNLTGVAPGEHCSLIARAKDGRAEVTASWVATYRGTADIPATTTIPATRLRGFDVVTADGRVLVRLAVPHR